MCAVLVDFDKNGVKTPVCFSEPSAYCYGSYFPYESELSTGSPPHISSGACATQKNKLAINRDKPLMLVNYGHHSGNSCCDKQKIHWGISSCCKPSYASLSLTEP